MTRYILQYSVLFISAFFVSCSKTLDLVPKDTMSDATFWQTENDFKLGANNLYGSLEGFNFDDAEADIAYSTGNDISKGIYQQTETSSLWSGPYVYIRNANNILEKVESFSNPEQMKQYAAEAYFFRAYNYWRLFRLYGGVPLITAVLDAGDEALYTARASRQETVALMLDDLTKAAAGLPLESGISAIDKGRVSSGAAEALKARIALFEGTWAKFHSEDKAMEYLDIAITSANAVVNSQVYSLFQGMDEQSYRYLFIEAGDDSPESVLDRRFQRNISGHSFPYDIDQSGYLATKKLADSYLSTDGLPIGQSNQFQGYSTFISEFKNRDPRMAMTLTVPGTMTVRPFYPTAPGVENWPNTPQRNGNTGYITYKYMSEDPEGNVHAFDGNSHSADRHIIRYAEVLLILAEAIYERNETIADADLERTVNVIRSRVGMPGLTNTFVDANGLNMREEIRRERTVELALEGFRYDDIRRWATAPVEDKQDIKGIKIKGSQWETRAPYNQESWQSRTDADGFLIVEASVNRFFENKHYLRPIPTREIAKYQGKLEQNLGW